MQSTLSDLADLQVSERDCSVVVGLAVDPVPSPVGGNEAWRRMYEMARDAGDPRGTATALQNIQSGLSSSGRFQEALMCARRLLTLGLETGDLLVVGHGLTGFAWISWCLGDHIAACCAAERAMQLADSITGRAWPHPFRGPEAIRLAAAEVLLTIRKSRGELRRAAADQETLWQIHRERGDALNAIASQEGMALIEKEMGRYPAALHRLSSALDELERAQVAQPQARLVCRAGLLGNMGVVLTHLGRTDAALQHIEKESEIYEQLSDDFGRIMMLGRKGRALQRAGRLEALASFEAMLSLAEQYANDSLQQVAHLNLSEAHLRAGNHPAALEHCERAMILAETKLGHATVDHYWLRAALFQPGETATSDPRLGSDIRRFIALAHYALEALRMAGSSSRPSVLVEKWISEFEAVIDAAFRLLPPGPLQLEPLEHSPDIKETIKPFLVRLDAFAQRSAFIDWDAVDIGFYCTESFRAQEFQEQLRLNSIDLEVAKDVPLAGDLARIDAELEKVLLNPPIFIVGTASFEDGRLMANDDATVDHAAHEEERRKYAERIVSLTEKRAALDPKTAPSTAGAASAESGLPVRLQHVRDVLADDEILLEFVLLGQPGASYQLDGELIVPSPGRPDGEAWVVAITRTATRVFPIGRTATIESRCRTLLEIVDTVDETVSPANFQQEARSLFDVLLKPLLAALGSSVTKIRHLVIAPDGALHQLPFDILVKTTQETRRWSDLDYLARHYSTEYVPSATMFVDQRLGRYRRGEPGRVFVGFGDPVYNCDRSPESLEALGVAAAAAVQLEKGSRSRQQLSRLPGTRREVQAIAQLIDAQFSAVTVQAGNSRTDAARLFFATDATKTQLSNAQLLLDAEYLHLACHGVAGKGRFLDGALFLSDGPDEDNRDGVLTAGEIMHFRTNAKLVVLSACETGLGKLTRGEGLQGMVRAWVFAGAQSVIATFWSVDDDATSTLMEHFYSDALTAQTTLAEALATAKRSMIADEQTACPNYWGSFTISGGRADPQPAVRQETLPKGRSEPKSKPEKERPASELSPSAQECLGRCGREWENAIESDTARKAFFAAATELALGTQTTNIDSYSFPVAVALRRVAKNCQAAWEHWSKERRPPSALLAYDAYVRWCPEALNKEWEAIATAYAAKNLQHIQRLARENALQREFDVRITDDLIVFVTTTVKWLPSEGSPVAPANPSALCVAVPVEDPAFSCTSEVTSYCRDAGLVVLTLRPGESFVLSETLKTSFANLANESYIYSATWGSSQFATTVTLQFGENLLPLRLQKEHLRRGTSHASIKFTPESARVILRPVKGPWVERIALLFRRVPGAVAFLGSDTSPFPREMEFSEFEVLWRAAAQTP